MSLIGLRYLSKEWMKAEEPPMGYGSTNVKATIFFLFCLTGTWVSIVQHFYKGALYLVAQLRLRQCIISHYIDLLNFNDGSRREKS